MMDPVVSKCIVQYFQPHALCCAADPQDPLHDVRFLKIIPATVWRLGCRSFHFGSR